MIETEPMGKRTGNPPGRPPKRYRPGDPWLDWFNDHPEPEPLDDDVEHREERTPPMLRFLIHNCVIHPMSGLCWLAADALGRLAFAAGELGDRLHEIGVQDRERMGPDGEPDPIADALDELADGDGESIPWSEASRRVDWFGEGDDDEPAGRPESRRPHPRGADTRTDPRAAQRAAWRPTSAELLEQLEQDREGVGADDPRELGPWSGDADPDDDDDRGGCFP